MTIANTNFEEWILNNKLEHMEDFEFSLSKMSLDGALFEITGIASLYTPNRTIVDDFHAPNRVVIVLVGNRQRVESLVYLTAKLVFRVVNEHGSQGVTTITEFLRKNLCAGCSAQGTYYDETSH